MDRASIAATYASYLRDIVMMTIDTLITNNIITMKTIENSNGSFYQQWALAPQAKLFLLICAIVVLVILIGVIFAVIVSIVSLRRQRKILRIIEEIKEVSQNQERQKGAEESGQGNQADNDT